MADLPQDFDLRITPDWLKETSETNPYASYAGEPARPGKPLRERPGLGKGRPDRPDRRSQRREQHRAHAGREELPSRTERPGRGTARSREPGRAQEIRHPDRRPVPPAPVAVEFVPEPGFAAALDKQIKASARAWPLLDIARRFMAGPEFHRVRLRVTDDQATLFQCGDDGPVAFDATLLVHGAFQAHWERFYEKCINQREEIRGAFSNVARCRRTGTILGPTNHHTYRPALHKLYATRFQTRMSFEQFQEGIEIVCDPALVAEWQEQARTVLTFKTRDEPEPRVFDSENEAEQDFRARHFPAMLRSGSQFEIPGKATRNVPDRGIKAAIRMAWDRQRAFPSQMLFHLRRHFLSNGLHVFRHGKHAQFVTAIRPKPLPDDLDQLAAGVAAIVRAIQNCGRCTRHELALQILPREPDHPELARLKEQLAADLHWLIDAGRVVEFLDGFLELAPKPPAKLAKDAPASGEQPAEPAPAAFTSPAGMPIPEPEQPPEQSADGAPLQG